MRTINNIIARTELESALSCRLVPDIKHTPTATKYDFCESGRHYRNPNETALHTFVLSKRKKKDFARKTQHKTQQQTKQYNTPNKKQYNTYIGLYPIAPSHQHNTQNPVRIYY